MTRQRCLAAASVVTARSQGCAHTAADVATPVVAVPRAPGVLRCPTCAEPVVAGTATGGHGCDRCGRVTVGPGDRAALVTGSSLIIVAQLCSACADACRALRLDDGPLKQL